MVDNVVQQANKYFQAVKKSVDTATDGQTFASDALAFCEFLAAGRNSVNELTTFLISMQEIASKAHQDAKDTHEEFREVRVELFQVRLFKSWTIPFDNNLGFR
jgi:hypothetical protein